MVINMNKSDIIHNYIPKVLLDLGNTLKINPSYILGTLFALYLLQIAYYVFLHPLSIIPGPLLANFSNLWITLHYFRGTWHDDILHLHREYGPVVRIRPNEISFVDAAALKALYGHGTGTKKTPAYSVWSNPNSAISFFATQDVELHKYLRSRVSPAYTMSSVLAVEPYIQEICDKLWVKFREAALAHKPLDLGIWSYYFVFDVISHLTLGGELGFVANSEDINGIIGSLHQGVKIMANIPYVPFQMWWFTNKFTSRVMERFGGESAELFPNFVKLLLGRIDERMNLGALGRRKDMLQHFIEMKGMSDSAPTTRREVLSECLIAIGAGADTTAAAIMSVLGRLITNPSILIPLQREIDGVYQSTQLDSHVGISYKEAAKLPFLSAVIKESLRLCPPISYQLPRFTPESGIRIGKYQIPGGMHAGISVTAMNRSQEIFGKDAEEFKPSRWILDSPQNEERIKKMNKLLVTFGMGDRGCIGQNIAQVEIFKFIAQFVLQFDLEAINSSRLWTTRSQFFISQSDFWVKLKIRSKFEETKNLKLDPKR